MTAACVDDDHIPAETQDAAVRDSGEAGGTSGAGGSSGAGGASTAGRAATGGRRSTDAGQGDAATMDATTVTDASDASPLADAGEAALCASTGGTVETISCCAATNDFPDTCLTGACGCAPASSHDIQGCACPVNDCFEPGTGCRPK